ncbi:alpha/beta fold hydrolase [Lewinella sp. W8]|uniref:T9SS type A sorting domain-containing protein n=1 Tax=Lewinella sp. W8 TaxID=2528208 RepID=UPI00106739C4|nr:alpha/beta fold hydrolase [Lewinella sp. W8]MTB50897.1 T9SS type A sorting domain-containing protein [Lewinella sp. W8]
MRKFLLLPLCCLFTLTVSAQEVIAVEQQDPTLAFILSIVLGQTVDYDVENYAITYTTTDPMGQPDTATGLLCVPMDRDLVFPLAVYNHGTVDRRDAVLSVEGNQERFVAQGMASFGFITLAPDYLGLGGSDGIHPYLHADTEASAAIDMVIAVRAWLDEQNIARNEQVFVTGYSQGGHASMATHKTMEANADGPAITAAAHLSGAYAITPPNAAVLGLSEVEVGGFRFFLNQVIGYEFVYQLYGGVDSLFVEPYRAIVQDFVAGSIDLTQLAVNVDSTLRANGDVVGDIFSPQYVLDVTNQDTALLAAYAENTVSNFAPEAPTLIYYCNADEVVPPAQAQAAFAAMTALGSTSVIIEDGGAFNHLDCVEPAALRAIDFFLELANVFPVSLNNVADRPDLQLVPNPIRAGQTLTMAGLQSPSPFTLYDQSGRSLTQGITTASGHLTLPAYLPKGMLVVQVELPDGSSVIRKVIVQ